LDIVGARQLSGARVVLRTFLRFLRCFRGKKIHQKTRERSLGSGTRKSHRFELIQTADV